MPDTRQQTPADKIRATYTVKAAEIKSRRDLSDEGRARQLAKALVTARDEMTKLKRKDAERTNRRRADLQQRHFGNSKSWDSATVISFRDALDRADRLKSPDEAAALLERAIMTGDEVLSRAVAQRAMGRITLKGMGDGWSKVVDRWLEGQPSGTVEDIQELADIEHDSTNVKSRFVQSMSYSLPTPVELNGKNIDRMAYEADGLPE